jgi:hypothetical protein
MREDSIAGRNFATVPVSLGGAQTAIGVLPHPPKINFGL